MTVGELISELSIYDKDVQVHINGYGFDLPSYRVSKVGNVLFNGSPCPRINWLYGCTQEIKDDIGKKVVVIS